MEEALKPRYIIPSFWSPWTLTVIERIAGCMKSNGPLSNRISGSQLVLMPEATIPSFRGRQDPDRYPGLKSIQITATDTNYEFRKHSF